MVEQASASSRRQKSDGGWGEGEPGRPRPTQVGTKSFATAQNLPASASMMLFIIFLVSLPIVIVLSLHQANKTMAGEDDFMARALSSLSHQMALANAAPGGGSGGADEKNTKHFVVEAHAKSLVNDDTPKIDSAVKSYLSLVAARSVVASEIDVLSENVKSLDEQVKLNSMDMKSALTCARKLLNGINTTLIPKRNNNNIDEEKEESDDEEIQKMMDAATIVVYNRLVENKDMKPSKVLGRKSLVVAWPYIQERFRRGIEKEEECDVDGSTSTNNVDAFLRSYSIEILPAIAPPQGIENDSWIAFYTEFGNLLNKACQNDESKQQEDDDGDDEDDSKLLWSNDKGVKELQRRQERRARRAEELKQCNQDQSGENVAESS